MGVYINMEMPKVGSKIITIYANGKVLYDGDYIKAVPVPEPHGRLIDADAFIQMIDDESNNFYAMNEYDSGLSAGYRASMIAAKLAPTIIPASEEG